jgi:23S rRNA-/tRNA-specific pseudouridylate synthase
MHLAGYMDSLQSYNVMPGVSHIDGPACMHLSSVGINGQNARFQSTLIYYCNIMNRILSPKSRCYAKIALDLDGRQWGELLLFGGRLRGLMSSRTSISDSYDTLRVLYEDEAMVVLNKPCFLATQGGYGIEKANSVDALLKQSKGRLSGCKLVHRLDKQCSGALVVAKDARYVSDLGKWLQGGSDRTQGSSVEKKKVYWALVDCSSRSDLVSTRSRNALGQGQKQFKVTGDVQGKDAMSLVEVKAVNAKAGVALVELIPYSGRMHQLRIHCARDLRMSILGDSKYGETRKGVHKEVLGLLRKDHQHGPWPPVFLHCKELRLPYLMSGVGKNSNFVKVEAPLPDHFVRGLELFFPGMIN